MLCPCCFCQNVLEVIFCKDCGAPLGCSAFLDPIHQIHALGFVYRRATGGPPSWKVLLGIWIIYFPLFAYSMMVLGAWFRQYRHNPGDLLSILLSGLFTGSLLCQTTMNYVRKAGKPQGEVAP